MSNQTVGTTAVALAVAAGKTPVVQNLGPGVIYLDFVSNVSASTGFEVAVDASFTFPRDLDGTCYVISSQAATDVRILVVG